ncbi:MAG TPA: DUF6295 family protein [Acidimicrobiales bacterium]|nr:DUF6295 family protein [Acidimicrobiales bacterium]
MCTYRTERVTIRGSGKGASGWFAVTDATVYLDHPLHAPADHTLNVDFLNPGRGPGARVAVELDPASARDLAQAILSTLDGAPPGLGAPLAWDQGPDGAASGPGGVGCRPVGYRFIDALGHAAASRRCSPPA